MLEIFKKGLLAGLGAVVVTRDKIEEVTRRLMQEGRITREEMEKMREDLVKSGEARWEEISAHVSENVRKAMANLDIASREEFDKLKDRVLQLEKRVAMLETPAQEPDEE